MYNIYTDKTEKFQCKFELEGASINKSSARLILESQDINLLFKGTINSDGVCEINISKLKNILSENTTGKLKLEVIADGDVFFCPWESDFKVLTSRKVTVEVLTKKSPEIIKEDKKPKINVTNLKEISKSDKDIIDFVRILKENNIPKEYISSDSIILPVIRKYKNDINNKDILTEFIKQIRNKY